MEPKLGFEVLRVEPKYFPSKVQTGDPNPRPPQAAGYEAVHFRCRKCDHTWRATESDGSLKQHVGFLHVTCPECGQEADEKNPPLP